VVLWGLLATLAGAVGACSSGSAPPAAADDAVLGLGRQVWTANCARCHGPAGGGAIGPRLAGRVTEQFPDPAAQAELIARGTRSMPPFRRTLSPEEIEAVVRYTREVL
jgi:mono/diheme cytochrome c family protein